MIHQGLWKHFCSASKAFRSCLDALAIEHLGQRDQALIFQCLLKIHRFRASNLPSVSRVFHFQISTHLILTLEKIWNRQTQFEAWFYLFWVIRSLGTFWGSHSSNFQATQWPHYVRISHQFPSWGVTFFSLGWVGPFQCSHIAHP